MKSQLLFYLSQKTSYCEQELKKIIQEKDIETDVITAATTPLNLGEKLITALSCVNLVFIVGGLGRTEIRGLQNVLSKALANTHADVEIAKLKNPLGDFGYIIRCNRQIIICLPDDPEEISAVLTDDLLNYVLNNYC